MSTTITVFDPTYKRSKTISVFLDGTIVIQDLDADPDYYLRMTTSAKQKNGAAISSRIIRSLSSGAGVGGTTQYDGSPLPYATMTAAVRDHVRRMVEGVVGQPTTAMDFSS